MPDLEVVNTSAYRHDAWSANASDCIAEYRVTAHAEPALLCQLLNLFALQYLIPQALNVVREEDSFTISVAVDNISWHRAQVIGEKMRNLIDVCSVELTQLDSVNYQHHHVALAAG